MEPLKRTTTSSVSSALVSTGILIKRSLSHIFRHIDQILSIVLTPIMFMLLFRYVFGGAIDTGGTTYVNFLVAGILVQTLAFGANTTAYAVAVDLQRGIVERLKTLPIMSFGVVIGSVTADLVRNFLSSIVMVGVALLVGFRPVAGVVEWVEIVGILLLFTFAFSWLSAIMGLLAKSVEAVQWMGFVLIFPLTFASSAFVPTDGMPAGLKFFAENQPVTHVIEAVRALMNGTPVRNHITLSIVWCAGFTLIAIPIATYLFRKHKGAK